MSTCFYVEYIIEAVSSIYVTLDHKNSLKLLGYICSNIVWVKIIDFSFMLKIIWILSKDHVPLIYLVNSVNAYLFSFQIMYKSQFWKIDT